MIAFQGSDKSCSQAWGKVPKVDHLKQLWLKGAERQTTTNDILTDKIDKIPIKAPGCAVGCKTLVPL